MMTAVRTEDVVDFSGPASSARSLRRKVRFKGLGRRMKHGALVQGCRSMMTAVRAEDVVDFSGPGEESPLQRSG